jgi:two-component system response regulator YesN
MPFNFEEILIYIDKNYNKNISLYIISDIYNLNYSYLSRIFKEKTGMNFVKYLNYKRINRAEFLLKYTNLRIYKISIFCGYYDVNYFIRIFKKYKSITPLEYRKKYKINQII